MFGPIVNDKTDLTSKYIALNKLELKTINVTYGEARRMDKRDTLNYLTTLQQPQLNMGYSKRSSSQEREKAMQDALKSFKDGQFKSLQSAALYFGVPISTLNHCHHGGNHELSPPSHVKYSQMRRKTPPVQWIIQQASIGFTVTPALIKETAQEIVNQHYNTTPKNDDIQQPVIGHKWPYRF
jgi:hypothetical protein